MLILMSGMIDKVMMDVIPKNTVSTPDILWSPKKI
jgi:hypothetical protein